MSRGKPPYGFSSSVSDWDLHPSSDTIERLSGEFERLTGIAASGPFRDIVLFRLIFIMRKALFREMVLPRGKDYRAEAADIRRRLEALAEPFGDSSKAISGMLHYDLVTALHTQGDVTALSRFKESLPSVLAAIRVIDEGWSERATSTKSFIVSTRAMCFRELARGWHEQLGMAPTKYADGPFASFLAAFISAIPITVDRQRLSISMPTNSFREIAAAIDSYPVEPRHPLLSADIIWPEVTGQSPGTD